jgi:hypothetical protein
MECNRRDGDRDRDLQQRMRCQAFAATRCLFAITAVKLLFVPIFARHRHRAAH